MMTWLPFALAGAVAQLVDGSLGMGFGLTSSTLLLTLGASAAVASAAVHFAEIGYNSCLWCIPLASRKRR